MSLGKKVTLNTGAQIPQLGFGTWQSAPGQVGEAVYHALKAGYRHLDLATIYQNQREVAQGIKRAFQDIPGLKREDLFITSKLWNSQHHPDVVEKALDDCLAELELDFQIIHSQNPNRPLTSGSATNNELSDDSNRDWASC